MRVRRLKITNFRGISQGRVDFFGHTLLVGGNNVGKSTVCEALDLVLGPERLFQKPIVDEHDFHCGQYQDQEVSAEIRIEAILTELSDEAKRRFRHHIRRWDDQAGVFVDEAEDGLKKADEPGVVWALPLIFIGRYDREEDDFVGNTFFDHPIKEPETLDEETKIELGQGRVPFTRAHKRLCGFIFLRARRTGSRALSFQRGSLLDSVLKLSGDGAAEMWQQTLDHLRKLEPAIGEIDQLKQIRNGIRSRVAHFVNLAPGDGSTAFFASDLTREHLREVVRLFLATQPGQHLVPCGRLGTGSINLLVFALLTFIAQLKDNKSVIFAMEEPEIALPPHTQRRMTRFVFAEMGQAIVTSHSPYVIEQFDPEQIMILNRDEKGILNGRSINTEMVKPRDFRTQRRQFAEAILSRAVLVVEGSTEAALFPAASSVMERSLGTEHYMHFDLAGVSIFNAGGLGSVHRYGSIFSALGKLSFVFYDKPHGNHDRLEKCEGYTRAWESPEKGIEKLLVKQIPIAVLRRFLEEVKDRSDYPSGVASYDASAANADVEELTLKVLQARKGDAYGPGYAAILISHCSTADELPETIRTILEEIHQELANYRERSDPLSC